MRSTREVLDWLERYGDRDGDGFIEYETRVPERMRPPVKSQGWKDSPTAVPDARGREVDNPIATSELQGYLYVGLQQAATVFARLGDVGAPVLSARSVFATPVGSAYAVLLPRLCLSPLPNLPLTGAR